MNICNLVSFTLAFLPLTSHSQNQALKTDLSKPGSMAKISSAYGRLPMQFEQNNGQTDKRVRFTARTGAGTLFLTDTEAVLTLTLNDPKIANSHNPFDTKHMPPSEKAAPSRYSILRMKLTGAKKSVQVSGLDKLPGIVNYFRGNDPKKWHTKIPMYRKTKFAGVYNGVDMVYYGTQDGKLEYDLIVKPGADPKQIKMAFSGATGSRVTREGDLALMTSAGEVRWHKPVTYQMVDGKKEKVACAYRIENSKGISSIQFALAKYDRSKTLIIDPFLQYSTYLGNFGTSSIAVDNSGSVYVTGGANEIDFPVTSGAAQTIYGGESDAFVIKLNANGSSLLYATYLGGSRYDNSNSITVDNSGNAYVTGSTASSDFPTTSGAMQRVFGSNYDVFVSKLNANGSAFVYSTYLGGSSVDFSYGIAVDSAGNAYVTGATSSLDFPTSPGSYQRQYGGGGYDAFVTKLSTDGSSLVYSTYIGGPNKDNASSIAVDSVGYAYIAGINQNSGYPITPGAFQTIYGGGNSDVFVTKLSKNGDSLVYSTYLGGSGEEESHGIAVDTNGNAYITGYSYESNFPTTPGSFQSAQYDEGIVTFVTKFNANGTSLAYSTLLGTGYNEGNGISVDSMGNAIITGDTYSYGQPTTLGAFQTIPGGNEEAFVTKLNADGSSLIYSTYLGGSGNDYGNGIAVDKIGSIYVTGYTLSSDFPTTIGAVQPVYKGNGDSFILKFNFATNLVPPDIQVYATTATIGQNANLKSRLLGLNGAALSGKTLAFNVNGNAVGSAITDGKGFATLIYLIPQSLGSGVKSVIVSYEGDSNYSPGLKSSRLTVIPISDVIGLGPITAKAGKFMYAGARLASTLGVSIAGRNLDFSLDGSAIGTLVTDGTGSARLHYPIPQEKIAGAHTLTASFAGDSIYNTVSKTVTLTIPLSNTSLAVYAKTAFPGQPTSLQCRLFNEVGHVAPNRSVSFSMNGVAIGTVNTDSKGFGTIAYTIPDSLGAGGKPISVTFAGDAVYNGCTGTGTLTIIKTNSSLNMVSAAVNAGQTLRQPVRLLGSFGNFIVGRTISLKVNGISAGTAVTAANGVGGFTYVVPSDTAPGTYTMTASFAGDSEYNTCSFSSSITVK